MAQFLEMLVLHCELRAKYKHKHLLINVFDARLRDVIQLSYLDIFIKGIQSLLHEVQIQKHKAVDQDLKSCGVRIHL